MMNFSPFSHSLWSPKTSHLNWKQQPPDNCLKKKRTSVTDFQHSHLSRYFKKINSSNKHKQASKQTDRQTAMVLNDDDYTFSDDDMAAGGYEYYEITTKDPGPLLLLGTVTISILLYCLLPFMVACGKRRERRRLQRSNNNNNNQLQVQGKNNLTSSSCRAAAEVHPMMISDAVSSIDGDGSRYEHQEISTSSPPPPTPTAQHKTKRNRRTARGVRVFFVLFIRLYKLRFWMD
jgi:hypothetical protein